jgi:hypothetical protein
MSILELVGWCGATFLLVGFVLNIFGKIAAGSFIYLSLNLAGSVLLLYNAYMNSAYPFVVVNAFWVAFSSWKILQLMIRR